MKEILDDFNQDYRQKSTLLVGKRVALAEELSKFICLFFLNFIFRFQYILMMTLFTVIYEERVRRIQEKLEEFIAALNQEK